MRDLSNFGDGGRVQACDPPSPFSMVKDLYQRAATFITEHGWCQGSLALKDGNPTDDLVGCNEVCLIGACMASRINDIGPSPAMNEALTKWNDEPGRTKEQVLRFLQSDPQKISIRLDVERNPYLSGDKALIDFVLGTTDEHLKDGT